MTQGANGTERNAVDRIDLGSATAGPPLPSGQVEGRVGFETKTGYLASKPVLRYGLKRFAILPLGIVVVATLAFLVVNVLPGDPARVIAGDLASPAEIARVRSQLGLDQPFLDRYRDYMSGVVHGDLGTSIFSQTAITEEIRIYLPSTLELVVLAIIFALILGLLLAVLASYFVNRAPDRAVRVFIILAQAVPDFLLGLILIYFFFFLFNIAPAPVGQIGLFDLPPPRVTGSIMIDAIIAGQWGTLWTALQHAMLPVIALGVFVASFFAKITRAVLIEALRSDYVEFARACGLSERQIIGSALKAVRTPIITYVGILLATLAGGAAIVETVFSWNGMGQWAIQSILRLDIPAIQGFIVVVGIMTLCIFVVIDMLVIALDPRARQAGGPS